ncbi:MAG: FAD-dependent oxidoreductase [Actinobacteria bacterium]|nr:FAD-dependent oxidoreductase [Actinomycetota bacterium]
MDLERVVVVGASLAGLTAAASLREQGWDGHLVVVDAAMELPADRPPLSKQVLAGTMDSAAARQPLADRIDELDIDLRLGHRVEGFGADDHRIKFFNDHELTADGVIVATGANARWPAPRDELPAGVHVVRTLEDSLALKAELDTAAGPLVVLGAGFIGAEVAATARTAGHDVTMIEAAPQPLARVLPSEVGAAVAKLHRDHGVDVRVGVGFASIDAGPGGRVESVTLSDGSVVPASVVVAGLGADPSIEWLSGSGLSLGNGVVCDETLLAAPGVTAAGDVANWFNPTFGERMRVEQWDHAIESGRAAAVRLLAEAGGDAPQPFASVPWFWSDQYDRKLQMAGRPSGNDEAVVIDGELGAERFAVAFRRGDRCTGVLACNRPRLAVVSRTRMTQSLAWDHVVGA